MRRACAFMKRNALEMLRDPVIYIFCLAFPVVLLLLFRIINNFTGGQTPMFEAAALVPGIMMFSFSFVMLLVTLNVSKDRTSAFLIRLYTSPMRPAEYVVGYTLPCFVVGIAQELVCVFVGWITCIAFGCEYFSFGVALLLMLEMLPMLLIFIFFGMLWGSLLNDKSGPGICSVFIAAAGVLGGAWMPLDIMGGFETFCRFLPFYPSVYIGRVITGGVHTAIDPTVPAAKYAFDGTAVWGLVAIDAYLIISVTLSLIAFGRNMKKDNR